MKRLAADLSLDRHVLQELIARKNVLKPRTRREFAKWTQQVCELNQHHTARLIPIPRMTLCYEHHPERHETLRMRLQELRVAKCGMLTGA